MVLRIREIFLMMVVMVLGCYCGGGVEGGRDAGVQLDVKLVCGNGRYPSFDYQCYGNVGCREVGGNMCGCRCSICEDGRCVEMRCNGSCIVDVGKEVEISDEGIDDVVVEDVFEVGYEIGDVVSDGGYVDICCSVGDVGDGGDVQDVDFEYVCKDRGDPDGVDFWGNLDEPIVYIAKVYMDNWITGDYVVWLEPGPGNWPGKEIYYLSLRDKKVRRVPNCDGIAAIRQMVVYEDKIYWNNHIYLESTRKRWDVMFYFNITEKSIKIISPIDGVYFPAGYKDKVIFNVVKPDREFYYLYDVSTNEGKIVTDDPRYMNILSDYRDALYENLIISGNSDSIRSFNIDTFEKKEIYKSDTTIFPNVVYVPIIPIMKYLDKSIYGHTTTDIFVVDIRDKSVRRITDDEEFQWAPQRYENLLIYHENLDKKSTDVGYGYIVVYDMETNVKRIVPNSEGLLLPGSTNGRYVLYTNVLGSEIFPIYLMDLEKLGVVKDGHVVPE